jgi:DHA1 family putative efflux transporter-like MFS transporter
MSKWLVYVLAAGGFMVGTVESIVTGIIEMMAHDLNVSISSIGQLVTLFALGVGIGGPILIAFTARFERKKVLLLSLGLFIVGNILTFVSPNYELVMLSRILLGVGGGAYIVVAMTVATTIVSREKSGSAISIVLTGVTSALVLGVPLGTLLSNVVGWSYLFLIIAILTLILFFIIYQTVPDINEQQFIPLSVQIKILKDKKIITSLMVSLFIIIDYSVLFTYLTPYLQEAQQGIFTTTISLILLVSGISSMIGARLGGLLSDRWGCRVTIYVSLLLQVVTLILLPFLATTLIGIIITIVTWISSIWVIVSAQQVYLVTLSPKAPGIALSVNTSFFQFGFALGAGLGGIVITNFSVLNLAWVAGIMAIVALICAYLSFLWHEKDVSNRQPSES